MQEIALYALLIISFTLLLLLISKSKKLNKSNINLQEINKAIDSINLPIFYKNKEGKFINCNKTFEQKFQNFKKDAIEELKEFSTTCTKETDLTYDNNIKKQTLIYYTNYLEGGVGVLIDISELTKDKKRIFEKYDELKLILKGSQEGYWEWDIKTNNIILSKEALKILRYTEEEKPPQSMTEWMNLVESYDMAKTNEALASHLDGRSTFIDVNHRLKTSVDEIWVNLRGKGIYGKNNEIIKVYGTLRDATKEKRELTKITKERDLYMTFMDNLPALSFIKDLSGKYIYINNFYQKLLGFKSWKNRKAEDLFSKEIAENIVESDREALYEGIFKHEESISNEENQTQLFETYKFPISKEKDKLLCGFGLDITNEKIYKEKIALYTKIIENTTEKIIVTGPKGNIIYVNKAFTKLSGFSEKDVIGKNPRIWKSDKHTNEFYKTLWVDILTKGTWSGEIFNKNKKGIIMPELMNISAIRNDKQEITHFVAISQSIEEQKKVEDQLKQMAHFDMLTSLPNRSLFEDRLLHAIQRASRDNNTVGLLFIDLDDFKIINDEKGHESGDIVLKEVANRLLHAVRDSDTVARLGGDEFVVILEKMPHIEDISLITQKIISELSAPIYLKNNDKTNIGASVGISIYPNHTQDAKELLKFADLAMYEAKNYGKNCYKIYTNN